MVGKPAKYFEKGGLEKPNLLIVIIALAVIVLVILGAVMNYYPSTFTSVNETRNPMLNEVFHIQFDNNTVANHYILGDYNHDRVELVNWTYGRIDPTGSTGIDKVYDIYTFRAIGLGDTIISFRMTTDLGGGETSTYKVDVKVR